MVNRKERDLFDSDNDNQSSLVVDGEAMTLPGREVGNKEQYSTGLAASNIYLCNFFTDAGCGSIDGEQHDTPVVEDSCGGGQGVEGSPLAVVPPENVAP